MNWNRTQTWSATHQYSLAHKKSVQYLKVFRKKIWKHHQGNNSNGTNMSSNCSRCIYIKSAKRYYVKINIQGFRYKTFLLTVNITFTTFFNWTSKSPHKVLILGHNALNAVTMGTNLKRRSIIFILYINNNTGYSRYLVQENWQFLMLITQHIG